MYWMLLDMLKNMEIILGTKLGATEIKRMS